MKGKNLAIYIIICLLAIALVAWGFLMFFPKDKLVKNKQTEQNQVVTPTVNTQNNKIAETPTTQIKIPGWLTYQNKELGFECQYPSDWKKVGDEINTPSWLAVAEKEGAGFYKKSLDQAYPNEDFPIDALISISTIDNPKNLSIQDFFKKAQDDCIQSNKNESADWADCSVLDESHWQQIIINNKTALRSGKIVGLATYDRVYIQLVNKFLVLDADYSHKEYSNQLSDIFNKFISSFKFTE